MVLTQGRRAWQPTPVFLPGESHGQRTLAGYSPWGRKELDMMEATGTQACTQHRKRNKVPAQKTDHQTCAQGTQVSQGQN